MGPPSAGNSVADSALGTAASWVQALHKHHPVRSGPGALRSGRRRLTAWVCDARAGPWPERFTLMLHVSAPLFVTCT